MRSARVVALFAAMFLLASAAFAGPPELGAPISPAFPLDTSPVLNVPASTGVPAVATNGSIYLVAWVDTRGGSGQMARVVATRVTQDGTLLDPSPIVISTFGANPLNPAVASDGSGFLVVWAGWDGVYAARISPAGDVLDPEGIPIGAVPTPSSFSDTNVSVAWNGTMYGVAWRRSRPGTPSNFNDVMAARVQQDGTPLDDPPVTVSSSTLNFNVGPNIVASGSDFLVMWGRGQGATAPSGVLVSNLPASGPATAEQMVVPGSLGNTTVLALGSRFFVVWPGGPGSLRAKFVSTAGVPEAATLTISIPSNFSFGGTGGNRLLGTTNAGTGYLVWVVSVPTPGSPTPTWYTYGHRISPDGTTPDGTGILLRSGALNPGAFTLAATSGQILLASNDYGSAFGARFSTSFTSLDLSPIVLAPSTNAQPGVFVAASSSQYLAVWGDNKGSGTPATGSFSLYGARVAKNGTIIDSQPLLIAQVTATQNINGGTAASDGANFLVAWTMNDSTPGNPSRQRILAARVLADGSLPDGNGVEIASIVSPVGTPPNQTTTSWANIALAAGATSYAVLVAQRINPSGTPPPPSQHDVLAKRVSFSGVPLDTAWVSLRGNLPNNSGNLSPAMAAVGDSFLAVWQDDRNQNNSNIYGNWFQGGTAQVAGGFPIANNTYNETGPAVASSGSLALVAWNENWRTLGRRLTPSTLMDPVALTIGRSQANNEGSPIAATFTGSDFLVVWRHVSWVVDTWMSSSRASQVTTGGIVRAPLGFEVLAPNFRPPSSLQMASTGDNGALMGFTWTPFAPMASQRVYGSLISTDPVTLSVTLVGGGSVASDPLGIDCGGACSKTYPRGTEVELTETPAPGFVFAGWSGGDDCADGVVTLGRAESCTATFIRPLGRPVLAGTLDFNGDGAADVVRYDRNSGMLSIGLSNQTGIFGSVETFFGPDMGIYLADFDGNGATDVLGYNRVTGLYVKAMNDGTGQFTMTHSWWSTGWNVYVVDFNGDGRSDLFLYHPTAGGWFKLISTGGRDFTYYGGTWSTGWTVYPMDLNGDGRTDIFLYDGVSGNWFSVINDGGAGFSSYTGGNWSPSWTISPADFNGDHRGDFLLYNRQTGGWYVVLNQGASFSYVSGTWSPGWSVSVGDFNGDGRSDIFLYDPAGGGWYEAIGDGTGAFTYYNGAWSPNWAVYISDFNGDAKTDVLLYDPATGTYFQVLSTGAGTFSYSRGQWKTSQTIITRTP